MAASIMERLSSRQRQLQNVLSQARLERVNLERMRASGFSTYDDAAKAHVALIKSRMSLINAKLEEEIRVVFGLDTRHIVSLDEPGSIVVYDTSQPYSTLENTRVKNYMNDNYPPTIIDCFFPTVESKFYNVEASGALAWLNQRRKEHVAADPNAYFLEPTNLLKPSNFFGVDFAAIEDLRIKSVEKLQSLRKSIKKVRTAFNDDVLDEICGAKKMMGVIDKYIEFYEGRLVEHWQDGDSAMESFVAMHDYLLMTMGVKFADMHRGDVSMIGRMTDKELTLLREVCKAGLSISKLTHGYGKFDDNTIFVLSGIQQLITDGVTTVDELLSLDGLKEAYLARFVYQDSRRDSRFYSMMKDLYENVKRMDDESVQ